MLAKDAYIVIRIKSGEWAFLIFSSFQGFSGGIVNPKAQPEGLLSLH